MKRWYGIRPSEQEETDRVGAKQRFGGVAWSVCVVDDEEAKD